MQRRKAFILRDAIDMVGTHLSMHLINEIFTPYRLLLLVHVCFLSHFLSVIHLSKLASLFSFLLPLLFGFSIVFFFPLLGDHKHSVISITPHHIISLRASHQ